MRVTRDMHLLDYDETAAQHLVQDGQQAIDGCGLIDDLDLFRQVVG